MIPEINKTYNYFDDEKISSARLDKVLITEIIPFNLIDEEALNSWKDELQWKIYAKETDYFVKALILEENEEVTFVRCTNNGWFSLGWWAGRLDIDGGLTKSITI